MEAAGGAALEDKNGQGTAGTEATEVASEAMEASDNLEAKGGRDFKEVAV
jgi:hypothetical protein